MRTATTRTLGILSLALLGAVASGVEAAGGPAVATAILEPTAEPAAVATPAAPSAPAAAPEAAATCTGVTVAAGATPLFEDDFESGDTTAWGDSGHSRIPSFSARQIVDLQLEVLFADGSAGEHLLRLELKTPRGHHYQTLTVPVSDLYAPEGALRRVEGYPYPLEVRRMTSAAEAAASPANAVAVRVPVAGTAIVVHSLYGEWTAEAFMDADLAACAAASFRLRP